MAVRPFLRWPDPRLRAVCAPVGRVDDEVRRIWDDMLDSMYAMPGVGLAAPQIGVMLRLAVVDCSEGRDGAVRMADPELLAASTELAVHKEGSPNLPGVWEDVARPSWARIGYLDETGARVEREFAGLWAASALHQLDHLDGRLFIERLSPLRRRRALERARKAQRRARHEGRE
ncbi:peptide deformylase [Oceanicella actignis]|uniref:Peptide deformylase-like n=1 Tax=Oceanicella actignis TaxID=1189325 RepID=A0A1M7SDX4_9RHOB|nr:peptide deformylase [Oceanicella actignis]TYO91359.1 peptide deformylase [Oceanicella actignis]SET24029.1 peptide deformylase [Oceanicella actignis]SHN56690.1 peptide deformylase [Oceanicella actignis]